MPQMTLSPAGEILRRWRAVRGKSQLDLALDANVSTRHLSFIETGRSCPSREMLVALSEALDIPLRERNALLLAGGLRCPIQRDANGCSTDGAGEEGD